jgi:hypothetical protein
LKLGTVLLAGAQALYWLGVLLDNVPGGPVRLIEWPVFLSTYFLWFPAAASGLVLILIGAGSLGWRVLRRRLDEA